MKYASVLKLTKKSEGPASYPWGPVAVEAINSNNENAVFPVDTFNSTIVFNYLTAFRDGQLHFADTSEYIKVFSVVNEEHTEWLVCFLCGSLASANIVKTMDSHPEMVAFSIARDDYIDMCNLTKSGSRIIEVPDNFDPNSASFSEVKAAYDSVNDN